MLSIESINQEKWHVKASFSPFLAFTILKGSSESFVYENEHKDRNREPENIRNRRTEKIIHKREWKIENDFLRKKRDHDAHEHPDHKGAHHEHSPKKIIGSIRDMEIEKMLIDRGQEYKQSDEQKRIGILRIRKHRDRHDAHEGERDVDIYEDIDELVPTENETGRDTRADKKENEREHARDILRESDTGQK
jgi:hypothetical protein